MTNVLYMPSWWDDALRGSYRSPKRHVDRDPKPAGNSALRRGDRQGSRHSSTCRDDPPPAPSPFLSALVGSSPPPPRTSLDIPATTLDCSRSLTWRDDPFPAHTPDSTHSSTCCLHPPLAIYRSPTPHVD